MLEVIVTRHISELQVCFWFQDRGNRPVKYFTLDNDSARILVGALLDHGIEVWSMWEMTVERDAEFIDSRITRGYVSASGATIHADEPSPLLSTIAGTTGIPSGRHRPPST